MYSDEKVYDDKVNSNVKNKYLNYCANSSIYFY